MLDSCKALSVANSKSNVKRAQSMTSRPGSLGHSAYMKEVDPKMQQS